MPTKIYHLVLKFVLKFLHTALLLIVLHIHSPICGQTTAPEDPRDTLSTTLPAAMVRIAPLTTLNTLDFNSLQNQALVDPNDALGLIPGVQIQSRGAWGAQGDLIIDGSTFEQTMLMLNGIKLFDVQTAHNTLHSPIPFCAIDQIKIQRGTQSPYRGVGGLAGAIDLILKPKTSNYVQSYFSFLPGRDSLSGSPYYQTGVMSNLFLGGPKHSIMLSAELDTSTGYRENSRSGNYKLSWISSHALDAQSTLDIILALGSARFDARDFYVSPFDFQSQEKLKTNLIMTTFRSQLGPWKTKTVYYNRNGFDHYVYTKKNPSIYQNYHQTNTAGIEQHFHRINAFGQMNLGIEWRNEKISSTNLGEHHRRFAGILARQHFRIRDGLSARPAIYAAYSTLNKFQLYPGLDLKYHYTGELEQEIALSMGRGMRNPSFTDLYYEDSGNKGNPGLVAENGYTYTLDYSLHRAHRHLLLHSFYRDVRNFISWTDIHPSPDTLYWYPQNNAQVSTYGIGVQVNFSSIHLGDGGWYLSQNMGYQYNAVSDPLENTKNSISILQHQWIENLGFGLADKFWWNWNIRWQRLLNGYQYSLLDTRMRYFISSSFSVLLDANNLLDTDYQNLTVPMPGRHFRIGIIWDQPSNR